MGNKKCAVIAGAGGNGIGFATTKKFLANGWNVVMFGHNESGFKAHMDGLGDLAVNCRYVIGDILNEEDCQKVVDYSVSEFGSLDGLYNGIGWMGNGLPYSLDVDLDEFRRVVEVDLVGAFSLSRIAARVMQKQGSGVIVNTGSIAGVLAGSGPIAYSCAKAGVEMLTKFLAKDVSRYGVRFVTVDPGWVETDIDRETLKKPGIRDMAEKLHCSKRIMQPEETAEVIYFLMQPEAKVINGSTVMVDDGFAGFKEGEVILV